MSEHRQIDFDGGPISEPDPRWPQRIIELGAMWAAGDGVRRDEILGEMWELLNVALLKYIRLHSRRYDYGSEEDFRDIAAEKSLELFHKIDQGAWNPASSDAARLCAFISTLARFGLIDHLRVVGSKRPRRPSMTHVSWPSPSPAEEPETRLDRRGFVEAINGCVAQLSPRARAIWFLRVLLDMPSRLIARHPAVNLRPGAVDVTLLRCRTMMRRCLGAKGYEPADLRPGTFVDLWEGFQDEVRRLTKGDSSR